MVDETCSNCHIGTRHRRRVTLTYWAGDQLVLIPNKTAWVCDVCAEAIPDQGPIEQLEHLLGIDPAFSASLEENQSSDYTFDTLSLIALRRRSV